MEIIGWPQVNSRPMFGMTALYRQDKIFVLLPRIRAIDAPNSIAFKIHPSRSAKKPGKKAKSAASTWQSLELESEGDLQAALRACQGAYQSAK